MTNGDKIRSMTDEELAAKMIELRINAEGPIGFCKNKKKCEERLEERDYIPEEWCTQCMLEWMKGESRL